MKATSGGYFTNQPCTQIAPVPKSNELMWRLSNRMRLCDNLALIDLIHDMAKPSAN